jgi:hypothetical protein
MWALKCVKALGGAAPQDLMEIRTCISLTNEPEGMDKDKSEALIIAIAKDLSEKRKDSDATVQIDTQVPNADVRIVQVVENLTPENRGVPELLVDVSIAADNPAHANILLSRIQASLETKGSKRVWISLADRIKYEMQDRGMRDRRPRSNARAAVKKEVRVVKEPQLHSMSTEFLRLSTEEDTCVPKPEGALRLMVMGGRDPAKNDLIRSYMHFWRAVTCMHPCDQSSCTCYECMYTNQFSLCLQKPRKPSLLCMCVSMCFYAYL